MRLSEEGGGRRVIAAKEGGRKTGNEWTRVGSVWVEKDGAGVSLGGVGREVEREEKGR